MPAVYYRLESSDRYDRVTFSGESISLPELRTKIMERTKLACPLNIYDERAYQEYKGEARIPRDASVLVMILKITSSDQTPSTNPCDLIPVKARTGTLRKVSDTFILVDHFLKITNLARSTATEEEIIKYVSTSYSMQANEVRIQPRGHVFHQCSQPGHYKRDCPDKEKARRIRKTTGIPKTFLKDIDDPNVTGAMVTSTGTYAIPRINAQAYAEKKKSVSLAPAQKETPPKELVCPLCKDTMRDAATIPCCGNNFCDECIRTALLESEDHDCPVCYQTAVSPDTIEANKRLRESIENCDNSQMWSCLPAPSTSAQKAILHVAPQAESSPLPPAPARRLDTASKSDPPSKMHAMEQDPYARALASFYFPGHHHHHHSYRLEAHQTNNHRERRDDHRGSNSRFPSPGHHRSRKTHGSHWKRHHKEEQEHCGSHSRRHHRSRERHGSHWKKYHKEEQEHCGSHSRRHHRSRERHGSHWKRHRKEEKEHCGSHSRHHHRSRERHGSHWKRHRKEEQELCGSHSRHHHRSRDRSPSHHKRDHREEQSYRSRSQLPLFSHGPYSQRDRSPYREHLCSVSTITSSNTADKHRSGKRMQNNEDEATKALKILCSRP